MKAQRSRVEPEVVEESKTKQAVVIPFEVLGRKSGGPTAAARSRRLTIALQAAAVASLTVLYAAGAVAAALVSRPNNNEAWFAEPALQLIRNGTFSTPVIDGKGTWMAGMEHYTYWTMPLYGLVEAAWFKVVGFGLERQRGLSIVLGLVLLLTVMLLVRKLVASKVAAFLTGTLLACDAAYVQLTANARMDALAVALGVGGLTAFLYLRERSLRGAIAVASSMVAAACLTHPMAGVFVFCLLGYALTFDRKKMQLSDYAVMFVPYLLALVAWGAYIARDPRLFETQFGGNVNGVLAEVGGMRRFQLIAHPVTAVMAEWRFRLHALYHANLLPAIYLTVLTLFTALAWRKKNKERMLVGATGFAFLAAFTWADGLKEVYYVLYYLPWFTAALAIAVSDLMRSHRKVRVFALIWVVTLVTVEQYGYWRANRSNDSFKEYAEVIAYLKQVPAGASVTGSAEICYALGFRDNIRDDLRLGYYTGRTPDYIVASPRYKIFWRMRAPDPSRQYAMSLIATQYDIVFQNSAYTIYKRVGAQASKS